MSRKPRVLLLWPGTEGAAAGNFGVPQLVLLGTYVREQTSAEVDIRDLVAEQAFGRVDIDRLFAGPDGRGYDVIAFSVYSSFDHLKCTALAEFARQRWPHAVIVAGGYHPSARPHEYIGDATPFDVGVVGEGERPLVQVVESVAGGAPLRHTMLGPLAIDDLDDLPPSDWSLLERYRPIARSIASQAQVYLSRGCPFDCAFCMERAKREVSWRALSIDRAIDEIDRLHRFLDLRGWTLYFGDALFGMKKSWRRAFLERLAERDFPVEKYWLLIRVDLVDDEDVRLFGKANCGLGFGLESGDPGQLATIRKTGRLDDYLDRMEHIADRARTYDVPWGANVICGHPGETPSTMRSSAKYLTRLFGQRGGTTGFLSVDPFRLYPGSPIDAERESYERRFGTVFHRPDWWHDGDPEFLAEWVDPSSELDWLERERLQHELLGPVLAGIEGNFVYRGKAREYFVRAIRSQVVYGSSAERLQTFDRYYAWHRYLGRSSDAERKRKHHHALATTAREARERALSEWVSADGLAPDDPILCALIDVPREQFVPLDEILASTRDRPVRVDEAGLVTVSAMHAYALTFSCLGVTKGDTVLDLGAGTGYGSALLRHIVGPSGGVIAVEIDDEAVAAAQRNLAGLSVTIVHRDAAAPETWGLDDVVLDRIRKVAVGFAVPHLPAAWFRFALGTCIVVPLELDGTVRLVRATRDRDGFAIEAFAEVHYVPQRVAQTRTGDRDGVTAPTPGTPSIQTSRRPGPRLRLTVVP